MIVAAAWPLKIDQTEALAVAATATSSPRSDESANRRERRTCAVRLKIIDLSSSGEQPMTNEDGTLWLVFNGEIYNYQELRAELAGRGHLFRTATDTEVILEAYLEWGEGCLERLNGMFALAIGAAAALVVASPQLVAMAQQRETPFRPEDYWPEASFEPRFRRLHQGAMERRTHREHDALAASSRRGRLQGMEPQGGMTTIKAEVPMAEILTYSQALTSMTGGRGDYHMHFLRYEEVPSHIAQKVIEDAKKEKEEAKV